MTLRTAMADALTYAFDSNHFGESITYAGNAIIAIVDRQEDLDEVTGSVRQFAFIDVKVSDVASPNYRDLIVFDSLNWRVRRVVESDWFSHKLEVQTDERPLP